MSVPYSGTRFLMRNLGIMQRVHTYTPWNELMEILEGKTIITPMRDPAKNWLSWARRWPKDKPIDHQIVQYTRAWHVLHAVSLIKELDVIPVDLQQDKRVSNWIPVGDGDPGDNIHALNTDSIYELPIVQKYYGENI